MNAALPPNASSSSLPAAASLSSLSLTLIRTQGTGGHASRKSVAFSLGGEKLSSQRAPLLEAERILSSNLKRFTRTPLTTASEAVPENVSANNPPVIPLVKRPVLFLGFFPVYQLACYFKLLLSQNSAASANNNRLLNAPLAILEHRQLSSKDVTRALQAALTSAALPEQFHAPLLKKLSTQLVATPAALSSFFDNLSTSATEPFSWHQLIIIKSPYLAPTFLSQFQTVFTQLKDRKLKVRTTETYFAPLWQLNTINQLSRPQPKIFFIDSLVPPPSRTNTPLTAIIALSGLSTEKHVAILKTQSAFYPVYSAAGMFPFLTRANIPVTALISIDPGHANRTHFYWERWRTLRHHDTPPLIAPLSVAASATRHYEKYHKVLYYLDNFSCWESVKTFFPHPERMFVNMDASLALAGIRILARLGYKRILTYGIDFTIGAFKAHASTYSLEEHCFMQHTRLLPYETQVRPFFHALKTLPPAADTPAKQNYTEPRLMLYQTAYEKLCQQLQSQQALHIQRGETQLLPSTQTPIQLAHRLVLKPYQRQTLYRALLPALKKAYVNLNLHTKTPRSHWLKTRLIQALALSS